MDALALKEQLTLEVARMIREDFLFQNGFDPIDARSSLRKQYLLLKCILLFLDTALPLMEQEEFDFSKLQKLPVKEDIAKASFIPEEEIDDAFSALEKTIISQITALKTS